AIENIFNYIERGISFPVNNIISKSIFYNVLTEKHWEKLYRWYELSQEEFNESYEKTLRAIQNKEITEIGEVLQHYSLMLEMEAIGVNVNINSIKEDVANTVDKILSDRNSVFNNPD